MKKITVYHWLVFYAFCWLWKPLVQRDQRCEVEFSNWLHLLLDQNDAWEDGLDYCDFTDTTDPITAEALK